MNAKVLNVGLCLALAAPLLAEPSDDGPAPVGFDRIPDAPGGAFYSSANAVSADGRVVVGTASTADGSVAFRWTEQTGMTLLGDLPGGPIASYATGVSADGSVVVGSGTAGTLAFPILQAFRWTQSTGLVPLNDRPGGTNRCWAAGVSADGSVVVGVGSGPSGTEAVRWNIGTAMPIGLGDLVGGAFSSAARGISANGTLIVGTAADIFGLQGAVWTAPNAITSIGDLPGGSFWSEANAVSADGSTVIGSSIIAPGLIYEATRWTTSGGLVGIGDLPGGLFASKALAVSGDGKYIVGYGTTDRGEEAFLWTQPTGMLRLQPLLEAYGINLVGWKLDAALGISGNGRVIVGRGTNPAGNTEAWIARLPLSLCPGDATGDFTTDVHDVGALVQAWDTVVPSDDFRDLDGDGHIGINDMNVIISNWGHSCLPN